MKSPTEFITGVWGEGRRGEKEGLMLRKMPGTCSEFNT